MFGLGAPELIFILLLALLIFGPKKLPQIGRTLGRGMAEFRKASTDLQRAINLEIDEVEKSPPSTPPPKADEALRSVDDGPRLEAPADTQPREPAAVTPEPDLASDVSSPADGDSPAADDAPTDGDGSPVLSS